MTLKLFARTAVGCSEVGRHTEKSALGGLYAFVKQLH